MCRKDKSLNPDADITLSQSSENFEEIFFDKEAVFAIHKVLHTLDEPYKEVFSLRTFGELSFKQIAELFGKSETWARVTYHRARLQIKEELKRNYRAKLSKICYLCIMMGYVPRKVLR
jgi:RNA polymerase sigma-70 factor (ECF subfamily)